MRSMKVSIILTTDRPATDRRPATDDRPLISKILNGHISATGRPIHSMFGSRVKFSGTADLMTLFPFQKIQDGGRRHLGKISNGHISATGRPIHSMFGSRVGFSGTADLMVLFLPTTCAASLLAFGDNII